MTLVPRVFLRPIALALMGVAVSALSAENPPAPAWIEVTGPGTRARVVTDSGEKAGRKVAMQLLQFDRALRKRFAWVKADETPLVVFASADEAMVRSMAPDTTDAEKDNAFSSYLAGPTQHVGAMRTDLPETADKDRSPTRGFYRGRMAFVIDRSLGKAAPVWLSRGLVTFLSDAVVKDKEIQVGRMTAADGDGAGLIAPAAAAFFGEMKPADRRSDLLAGLFVHYLLIADNGRNAGTLDALLQALAENAPASSSSQAAIAKITALYPGFPKYLAAKKFPPLKLPTDPSLAPTALPVRSLPLAEALMLRAEVLFDLNRPVDARGLLRQVKAADPTLARPLEIEAVLYDREQRSAESKKAIEGAIQLGSKNASLYYRLAQLQWSRTMAKPVLLQTQKLLETARDLAPADPATLSYLAEIQGDLGLFQPALENAQRGATAASTDYSQMALARAQWNAKQTDPALATAKKALALAKLPTPKQRAQEFITFATKNKRAQAAGGKPYPSQFGPPPQGAFGVVRSAGGSDGVSVGQARTDSADASAITDCFAKHNDTACARAVPALEAACAEKQTTSCVSLGSLHDGGFGIPRDRKKAAALYKTACDLGDKPGCARFAVLEAQGQGVPLNAARASKTLESLCAEKVPEACIGLAQILQRTGFAVDRERARTLLKSACDAGSAEACGPMTSR